MIKKIKKYLCNKDPSTLAFVITISLVIGVEAWIIGPKFVWIVLIGIVLFSTIGGIGYGLFRAIKYLQTKCEEK